MTTQDAPQPTLFFEEPLSTTEQRVLVAAIKPNDNPDPRDVIKSVKLVGVLQPLLLRPSNDPQYNFEIIAGGRRHFSAVTYGLIDVPALITTGNETEPQLAMLRALENVARSANPVAEGRAFRKVLNSGMYASLSEMAQEMGLDAKLVSKRLKLVDKLADDILTAVENGTLAERIAERIVNLDKAYQPAAIQATREALQNNRRFTQKDLKSLRTRRDGDMTQVLGDLLGDVPSSSMTPLLSLKPAQLLAEEFRMIAQERGVPLDEVMAELGFVPRNNDAEPGIAALTTGPALGLPFSPAPEDPRPAITEVDSGVQVPALLAIEQAQSQGIRPEDIDLSGFGLQTAPADLNTIPWPNQDSPATQEEEGGPRMDDLTDDPPQEDLSAVAPVPSTTVSDDLPWPVTAASPIAEAQREASTHEAAFLQAEIPEGDHFEPLDIQPTPTPAPRVPVATAQTATAPAPRTSLTTPVSSTAPRLSLNPQASASAGPRLSINTRK